MCFCCCYCFFAFHRLSIKTAQKAFKSRRKGKKMEAAKPKFQPKFFSFPFSLTLRSTDFECSPSSFLAFAHDGKCFVGGGGSSRKLFTYFLLMNITWSAQTQKLLRNADRTVFSGRLCTAFHTKQKKMLESSLGEGVLMVGRPNRLDSSCKNFT